LISTSRSGWLKCTFIGKDDKALVIEIANRMRLVVTEKQSAGKRVVGSKTPGSQTLEPED
jgi:hypothetical protein